MDKETCHRVEMGLCRSGRLIVAQDFTVKHSFQATLARKIRDFRTRKASPMVQIRCSRGFDTKKEAFRVYKIVNFPGYSLDMDTFLLPKQPGHTSPGSIQV